MLKRTMVFMGAVLLVLCSARISTAEAIGETQASDPASAVFEQDEKEAPQEAALTEEAPTEEEAPAEEEAPTEEEAPAEEEAPTEEEAPKVVVIGGEEFPVDAEKITVENPDPKELLEKLEHFSDLKECFLIGTLPDAQSLFELEQAFPQVEFVWQVSFLGNTWRKEQTELKLPAVSEKDLSELKSALALLPGLEKADALDSGLSDGQMRELAHTFPQVFFVWQTTVAGVPVQTDAEELDLSNILLEDVTEAEESLFYLRNLKTLLMCDCGIDDETMAAFRDRARQQCKVVWQVHMGLVSVRSDITALMPYQFGYSGAEGVPYG